MILPKSGRRQPSVNFPGGGDNEGYTIRTSEWRYTEWRSKKVGKPLFVELYHCAKDPIETRNLAEDPKHTNRLKQMEESLGKGLEERFATRHHKPKATIPEESILFTRCPKTTGRSN